MQAKTHLDHEGGKAGHASQSRALRRRKPLQNILGFIWAESARITATPWRSGKGHTCKDAKADSAPKDDQKQNNEP